MTRCFTILLTALLSVWSYQSFAHEGHDHDEEQLTDKQVGQIAAKTLPALIQAKKVDAAWAKAQREDITITSMAGKDVWVVTYKNPDATVAKGKPLYLLFDDLGNFLEANHTTKTAAE
jgi:Family of unknown function (DUF6488)